MSAVAEKKRRPGRPKKPADAPLSLPSELLRVPGEIAEMLRTIEQHGLNGWNTTTKVLSDPECPLADWLRPLYDRVIKEKADRAAAMRRED